MAATVDLWLVSLRLGQDRLGELWEWLTPEERARASRFRFQRDRDRFVAARGTLRDILGARLGLSPERVRFGYGRAGKPFLLDHPDFGFNLSHAGELLLVGVSSQGPLGVDVEAVQTDAVVDATAPLVMSRPELDALGRLEGDERRACFARFWTRKEAYIKADGRGMSLELGRIDVGSGDDRPFLRDERSGEWTPCPRWTLSSLAIDAGCAAAVAAEGAGWTVARQAWIASDEIGRRSGSTQPARASADINRSLV